MYTNVCNTTIQKLGSVSKLMGLMKADVGRKRSPQVRRKTH